MVYDFSMQIRHLFVLLYIPIEHYLLIIINILGLRDQWDTVYSKVAACCYIRPGPGTQVFVGC